MEKLKIKNYLVGAYDKKAHDWFTEHDIPSVLLTNELPSTHMGWFNDFSAFQK